MHVLAYCLKQRVKTEESITDKPSFLTVYVETKHLKNDINLLSND